MELVGEADGVRWFNDSKATNAASAAPALAAFPPAPDQRLHWIAGGQAKGDGLAACRTWFGPIKRAYLIGEAMEGFAAEIGDACPVEKSGARSDERRGGKECVRTWRYTWLRYL